MEIKKSFDTLTRVTKIVVELSDEEMNGNKDPLTFFLTRSAVLNGQNKSLKAEVEVMAKDNERLRAEIVRLSGGERSSAMVTWNQNTKPEKPPCCAVCLNHQRGYFGKSYCYAGKYSREIINPFSGIPEWCPL